MYNWDWEMKRLLFLMGFSILLCINLDAQQGGILGFEYETVERNYNTSSNSENIYLYNYVGRPLKALQFKILIKNGLEFISAVSLTPGDDLPQSKFMFDYQVHNKTDENGIPFMEISSLILGNDFNQFIANNKYHLATIKYSVSQSQQTNSSIGFRLMDVMGATSAPVIDANISSGSSLTILLHPEQIKPESAILNQNFPNPFNPATKISWQSPVSGLQKIIVYDAIGKEISTIVNEYLEEGNYTIDFKDEALSSGIYFYQLIINYQDDGQDIIFSETKRMIFLK